MAVSVAEFGRLQLLRFAVERPQPGDRFTWRPGDIQVVAPEDSQASAQPQGGMDLGAAPPVTAEGFSQAWHDAVTRNAPLVNKLQDAYTEALRKQVTRAAKNLEDRAHVYSVVTAAGEPTWAIPNQDEIYEKLIAEAELKEGTDPWRVKISNTVVNDVAVALGLSFDVTNPLLHDAFKQFGQKITNIAEGQRGKIMGLVQRGYDEGLSVPDTAKLLLNEGGIDSMMRATRISRTEFIGGTNGGASAMMQLAGVKYRQWVATNDSRTRDDHAEADGQVVPLNQPFDVGGEALNYPGDPNGSAAEIINCRCTIIAADNPQGSPTPIQTQFGPGSPFAPGGWNPNLAQISENLPRLFPEAGGPVPLEGDEALKTLAGAPITPDVPGFQSASGYFGGNYDNINTLLRKGKYDGAKVEKILASEDDLAKINVDILKKNAADIKAVMEPTKVPIRAYRGSEVSALTKGDPADLVGKILNDKGFASTSLNRRTAEEFAKSAGPSEKQVILDLNVQPGVDVLNSDRMSYVQFGESEVVIAPDSNFLVTSVEQDEKGRWIVKADVLPPPPAPAIAEGLPGEVGGEAAGHSDVAYHVVAREDLSEPLGAHELATRGTGHFGTGTYLTSNAEDAARLARGEREVQTVNLSGLNLLRVRDAREGFALHDALRDVNDLVSSDRALSGEVEQLRLEGIALKVGHGATGPEIARAVESARADLAAGLTESDQAGTRLLRGLGYDGIDVRGIPELDNTQYGTVVFQRQSQLADRVVGRPPSPAMAEGFTPGGVGAEPYTLEKSQASEWTAKIGDKTVSIPIDKSLGWSEGFMAKRADAIAQELSKLSPQQLDKITHVVTKAGANPEDGLLAEKYGIKTFKSAANYKDGQLTFYNGKFSPGAIQHEAGHAIGASGKLEADVIGVPDAWKIAYQGGPIDSGQWAAAASKDIADAPTLLKVSGEKASIFTPTPGSLGVTKYGETLINEDWAEAIRLYKSGIKLTDGTTVPFADVFPNRAKILDDLFGKIEGKLPLPEVAPKVEQVAVQVEKAEGDFFLEPNRLIQLPDGSVAWDNGPFKQFATSPKAQKAVANYAGANPGVFTSLTKEIKGYGGGMNQLLRGAWNTKIGPKSQFDTMVKNIKLLDKAFDAQVVSTEEVTVYRGVQKGILERMLGQDPEMWSGKVFPDKGYLSTSRDSRVTDEFRQGGGHVLQIRVPEGLKGLTASGYEEVLFDRGTKLVFDGVGEDGRILAHLAPGERAEIPAFKEVRPVPKLPPSIPEDNFLPVGENRAPTVGGQYLKKNVQGEAPEFPDHLYTVTEVKDNGYFWVRDQNGEQVLYRPGEIPGRMLREPVPVPEEEIALPATGEPPAAAPVAAPEATTAVPSLPPTHDVIQVSDFVDNLSSTTWGAEADSKEMTKYAKYANKLKGDQVLIVSKDDAGGVVGLTRYNPEAIAPDTLSVNTYLLNEGNREKVLQDVLKQAQSLGKQKVELVQVGEHEDWLTSLGLKTETDGKSYIANLSDIRMQQPLVQAATPVEAVAAKDFILAANEYAPGYNPMNAGYQKYLEQKDPMIVVLRNDEGQITALSHYLKDQAGSVLKVSIEKVPIGELDPMVDKLVEQASSLGKTDLRIVGHGPAGVTDELEAMGFEKSGAAYQAPLKDVQHGGTLTRTLARTEQPITSTDAAAWMAKHPEIKVEQAVEIFARISSGAIKTQSQLEAAAEELIPKAPLPELAAKGTRAVKAFIDELPNDKWATSLTDQTDIASLVEKILEDAESLYVARNAEGEIEGLLALDAEPLNLGNFIHLRPIIVAPGRSQEVVSLALQQASEFGKGVWVTGAKGELSKALTHVGFVADKKAGEAGLKLLSVMVKKAALTV